MPAWAEHRIINKPIAFSTGGALAVFALFITFALISYNAGDPSFNRAADHAVSNWMGRPGAYIADPLLQFLGIAAGLFSVMPFIWAVTLLKRRPLGVVWLRIPMLFLCLIMTAALSSLLQSPEGWPFMSMGGFIGEYVRVELSSYVPALIYVPLVIAASLLSFVAAMTLTWGECKAIAYVLGMAVFLTARTMYRAGRFCYRLVSKGSPETEEIFEDAVEEEEFEPVIEKKSIVAYTPKEDKKKQKIHIERSAKPVKRADDGKIELPGLNLLTSPPAASKKGQLSENAMAQNARELEKVLGDFGVQGEIGKVRPGPVVTLYELEPAAGTKSSRVIGLADDIARSMSAISARIAVIPGRNAIGVELPNVNRETVYLRELLESIEYRDTALKLPLVLGKDIGGEAIIADLAKMPHLLVAGTTGSGKSVAINSMILSLLYRLTPEQCRFIMIDPKMLELSVYDGIPHLLSPVVTEPAKAVVALKWVVREMEERYRAMSNLGVRNIAGYNARIQEAQQDGEILERTVQTGFEPETGKPIMETVPLDMTPLPFIVVVVDEMADLMLVAGKDIEGAIQRLAQMARAAGIHIIMATQRPSVDVITGVIKANFPTRISFQVTSRIDSRTILGEMGAEQLLGMGDMLYMAGGTRTTRVHGPFVDDKEVEKIVAFLKAQGAPNYVEEVTEDQDSGGFGDMAPIGSSDGSDDNQLYDMAVAVVIRDKKASTSYVQRQLRIGYNRAATLIERMEQEGVVSRPNHAGKREVLVGQDGQ